MKASVEILSGLVRVGPKHDGFGTPFAFMVPFSAVDGRHAVIKGLTSKGDFELTHARAIIRALRSLGLEPTWSNRRHGKVQKRKPPSKRRKAP